jgi:HK97 family phage prohead protease
VNTTTHRTTFEIREAEGRTLYGLVVPYETETRVGSYLEQFAPGAFDGTDPDTVPLLAAHEHAGLPIGRTLALTDEATGLLGEFRISDTATGNEVLALARDGVPLGLSVGFRPDVDRWNPDRTQVTRVRATLGEISVVGLPAYPDAKVTAVRGATPTPRATLLGLALHHH